jgi:cell division protein FtsZ
VNEASTLIQEAAHEDANIIFGAVIDDHMDEGQIRVTVIATGLDDQRVRRGRRDETAEDAHGNVMRLRPEPAPMVNPAPAPAAEEGGVPAQAELSEPVDPPLLGLDGGAIESDDFVSPFEDELDVPTFLRRGGHAESDEEAEEPAFLRRSAD